MNYQYIAFDQNGQQFEGQIEAPDEAAAEEALWGQGLTVAQLTPVRSRPALHTLFPTFFGVKRRDLIIFSRQLATLLKSGIDILRALQLLTEQSGSRALRYVLQEVIASLQQGRPLSVALSAHPLVFPHLYVATITVGERTGNLEQILRQLAAYLEKEETLSRKMRDAMAYPLFVLAVAILVVIIMITVALPPMVDLFDTFDAQLPWPTRTLIAISQFANAYGLYFLFGGMVLTAVTAWWGSQPTGRRARDGMLLRLPLVGKVVLQGQISRFAHTASILIRAGLPLLEVMELVTQTTGNVVIASAFERARLALLTGQGLSVPFSSEPLLPSLLSQMVRVGEETGTLEENLETLANFYEEEVDRNTELMASFVEPGLTIFIAIIVGFIAVSMVMPMYSILSEIR